MKTDDLHKRHICETLTGRDLVVKLVSATLVVTAIVLISVG
jgi:hypothetical protein